MHFPYQAVVLATLAFESALAQPSHRHVHQHAQRGLADVLGKRQDYNAPGTYLNPATGKAYTSAEWACLSQDNNSAAGAKNGKTDAECQNIDSGSPSPAAPAVQEKVAEPKGSPASSSAPSPSSTGTSSSSGGSGSCVDISQVWKSGDTSKTGDTSVNVPASNHWTDKGTSNSKRATAAQDGYVGNTGSPYGGNIIPLSDCNSQDPDFTIKFSNKYADNRDLSVVIWNKVGIDGSPQSGPFMNSFFKVDLPAGKSAAFALAPNSQIAFSESSETCQRQTGAPGGWYCLWGEANALPSGQGAMSSWDVSLELDAGVPGELSVSRDGHADTTSSRSVCSFANGSQQWAGEGTSSTCNVNTLDSTVHLIADFGV